MVHVGVYEWSDKNLRSNEASFISVELETRDRETT